LEAIGYEDDEYVLRGPPGVPEDRMIRVMSF
jgi:hypothetical protein